MNQKTSGGQMIMIQISLEKSRTRKNVFLKAFIFFSITLSQLIVMMFNSLGTLSTVKKRMRFTQPSCTVYCKKK